MTIFEHSFANGFCSSRKNLNPITRSTILRDILEPFHFKTPQTLLDPRPERLDRIMSRKESSIAPSLLGIDVTVPPMQKMRVHQGSAPSSCAPSSSSSTSCLSSRVPRSSALLPISSSSPTFAHYVTLLSTLHIWSPESPRRLRHDALAVCRGWWMETGMREKDRIKGRGIRNNIPLHDSRESRRGPHSECFQRRASIGSLPDRVTCEALVLTAAPTDAGLLQSVELSDELIFPTLAPTTAFRGIDRHPRRRHPQRRGWWRRRRVILPSVKLRSHFLRTLSFSFSLSLLRLPRLLSAYNLSLLLSVGRCLAIYITVTLPELYSKRYGDSSVSPFSPLV